MSSFLAAHYPNTYMEQFCKALHPELELGTICVEWFRQATKHCTELIIDARVPTAYFWTTVKNFIFPDRRTEIISQKIPINIHPNRLSILDCQSLFLDIVGDYVERAPRYAAESTTNVMLWQVLYSLFGIMAMASLVVFIIIAYNKYGQPKQLTNFLEEIFKPENRLRATAARSLRLAKAELRNIKIKSITRKEDIVTCDRSEVLTLRISKRYEFLGSIIQGSLHTVGKFHRLYDHSHKTASDFKIEALNKAMKYLDNKCKKMHILLIFEDDMDVEEAISTPKHKSNSNSPRTKIASSPNTTLAKNSILPSKKLINNELDEANVTPKRLSPPPGSGYDSGSPRRYSTKLNKTTKSIATPPNSETVNTTIRRNIPIRSLYTNKSK